MKRFAFTYLLIFVFIPLFGQKDKKQSPVPQLRETYTRFSIFSFQDNRYIHQETNNVWTDTFIETKPKTNTIYLPGLGTKQACKYSIDECVFFNGDKGLELAVIPIDCDMQNGGDEKRILKIHHINDGNNSKYIYSLSYEGAKDLVLFHNYTDSELGQLLTKDLIRFE
jgi:hypothetical protein